MKEDIRVCRGVNMEIKKQDVIELMDRVITNKNLWRAYKKVKENNSEPGIDGITV